MLSRPVAVEPKAEVRPRAAAAAAALRAAAAAAALRAAAAALRAACLRLLGLGYG